MSFMVICSHMNNVSLSSILSQTLLLLQLTLSPLLLPTSTEEVVEITLIIFLTVVVAMVVAHVAEVVVVVFLDLLLPLPHVPHVKFVTRWDIMLLTVIIGMIMPIKALPATK